MSATSFTYRGDAPAVAGEPRYTTTLIGMDGRPRTTTPAGKVAEAEFIAWAKDIRHRAALAHDDDRETEFAAYEARMQANRALKTVQEAERDALWRQEQAAEKARRQAEREAASGEVWVRRYVDLGPVWTRRWLKDELEEAVPGIVHAELNCELTCAALRRGVEALKERRRRNQRVDDPVVLVVDVAGRYQRSKPTERVPLHEALKTPDRIAPSR